MKTTVMRIALLAIIAVVLAVVPVPGRSGSAEAGDGAGSKYICPPCHCDRDGETFDKPGRCPVCGMKLIEKDDIKRAAILVFDGVQIIDYTGPYEVFGQGGFDVFTVSETGETITTSMGMSVNPRHDFETSPDPTVLVIPGGMVHEQYNNPKVLEWIRAKSEKAEYVMSVCNGAFILAKTGLLDGMSATTFYGLIDELEEFAPKVTVVSDQRFVDNGKFITTAGLSSGIDGSLHVLSKLLGRGRAEGIALHLEYDWRPDSGFARAALADRMLPDIELPDGVDLQLVSTKGDRDHWEARYELRGDMAPADVLDAIQGQLAGLDNWSKLGSTTSKGGRRTTWRFTDENGGSWSCETVLETPTGSGAGSILSYRLRRTGKPAANLTTKRTVHL